MTLDKRLIEKLRIEAEAFFQVKDKQLHNDMVYRLILEQAPHSYSLYWNQYETFRGKR